MGRLGASSRRSVIWDFKQEADMSPTKVEGSSVMLIGALPEISIGPNDKSATPRTPSRSATVWSMRANPRSGAGVANRNLASKTGLPGQA